MTNVPANVEAKVSMTVDRKRSMQASLKTGGVFTIECYDKNNKLKWTKSAKNGVTNVGLDDQLDNHFNSGSQITTWFIGLINTGAVLAPGDTSASHAGWTEYVNYAAATRPTWTSGAAASQQVTNAVTVDYAIDGAGGTILGAFLISNNVKAGATGILYCTALFFRLYGIE